MPRSQTASPTTSPALHETDLSASSCRACRSQPQPGEYPCRESGLQPFFALRFFCSLVYIFFVLSILAGRHRTDSPGHVPRLSPMPPWRPDTAPLPARRLAATFWGGIGPQALRFQPFGLPVVCECAPWYTSCVSTPPVVTRPCSRPSISELRMVFGHLTGLAAAVVFVVDQDH